MQLMRKYLRHLLHNSIFSNNFQTTVWRLYFAGLNFRELLFGNISLKKFREFMEKAPRPHNGCGVLHLTRSTPERADSVTATYTTDHLVGALYSATLFPTSTFSEFVFRYLGVPLTFAMPDRAGSFSNGRYRT